MHTMSGTESAAAILACSSIPLCRRPRMLIEKCAATCRILSMCCRLHAAGGVQDGTRRFRPGTSSACSWPLVHSFAICRSWTRRIIYPSVDDVDRQRQFIQRYKRLLNGSLSRDREFLWPSLPRSPSVSCGLGSRRAFVDCNSATSEAKFDNLVSIPEMALDTFDIASAIALSMMDVKSCDPS